MTKNASFSFPDEIQPIYEKLKKIAKREGKSASNILTDFMVQYVGIHDPGNPQTLLSSFAPNGHITITDIVGRLRQQCLEYARNRNNVIRMKIIKELVFNSNIKPRERYHVSEDIANWLKEYDVSVWK